MHSIDKILEWYDRYPDKSFYRLIQLPPGQKETLLASSPQGVSGDKALCRQHLQQTLEFHAAMPEAHMKLKLGSATNDPSPLVISVFTPHPERGINGIGNYLQGGNQQGYYTKEHVDSLVSNAKLEAKIDRLQEKMEESGKGLQDFILKLCETPAIAGIAQALLARSGGGVSLQGFGNLPQEEANAAQYTDSVIDDIDENLSKMQLDVTAADMIKKLRALTEQAANGDPIAIQKLNIAINNL